MTSKQHIPFILLGIVGIAISILGIAFVSYGISHIETKACHGSSCQIFPETCETKGTEFPCYTAKGNYTFTYQGENYFYTTVLEVKTFYEVCYEACKEFTSSPAEECQFDKQDIQNTVEVEGGKYFVGGLLMTCNIVVLCVSGLTIGLGFKLRSMRKPEYSIPNGEQTSSEFNLVQLDDDNPNKFT